MDEPTREHGPRVSPKFKDRTGQRFGKLVVVRRVEDLPMPYTRKDGRPYGPEVQWLCRCDCGNERVVAVGRLRDGKVRSCGCYKRDPRPAYRRKGFTPGLAGRNAVLKQYCENARSRGLAFELTGEQFDDLTARDCAYCGCPPSTVARSKGRSSGDFTYNGIDRVDNSLGYVTGNVVPCCRTCNVAKGTMSFDEFMVWIARLARFHFFHPEVMPSVMLRATGEAA